MFNNLYCWLFHFSYLSVICCYPLMSRWLSWDFYGCPMRSRTHFWSFSFCQWLLCYVSVHVDLSFFGDGKEKILKKKIKNGFLRCLVLFSRLWYVLFTVIHQRNFMKTKYRKHGIIKVRARDHLRKNEKHAVLILFFHRTERYTGDPWTLNFLKIIIFSLVAYFSIFENLFRTYCIFRFSSSWWIRSIVLICLTS